MWKSQELLLSFFLSLHVAQAAAVRDVYLSRNTNVASDNFQAWSSGASLGSAERTFSSSFSQISSHGGVASTAAGPNITLLSIPRYTLVSAMPTSSSGSIPLYTNTSLASTGTVDATTATLDRAPSTRLLSFISGRAVTTSLPYRSLPSLASQLSDDVSSALNMLFPSSPTSSSSSSPISHLQTAASTTTIETLTSSSTKMSTSTSSATPSFSTSTSSIASDSASTSSSSSASSFSLSTSSISTSIPTTPTNSSSSSSDPTLSRAQLAGTIASAIVGASVLLICLFYLLQRHRRGRVLAQEARLEGEMTFHGVVERGDLGGTGDGVGIGRAGDGVAAGGLGAGIAVTRGIGRGGAGASAGAGARAAKGGKRNLGGAAVAKISSLRRIGGPSTRGGNGSGNGNGQEGVFPHSAWLYDPPVSPLASPASASATPSSSPLTPSPGAKSGRLARSLRVSGAGRLGTRLGRIHEDGGANHFADDLVSPIPISGSSGYGERGFRRWQTIGMERTRIGRNGEVPRPRSGVHELEDTQISAPGSEI